MRMDIHTDRADLLPSMSPGNASTFSQEDPDNIYSFSDNCKSDNESCDLSEIDKIVAATMAANADHLDYDHFEHQSTESYRHDNGTTSDNNSKDSRTSSINVAVILKQEDRAICEEKLKLQQKLEMEEQASYRSPSLDASVSGSSSSSSATSPQLYDESTSSSRSRANGNNATGPGILSPIQHPSKKPLSGKPKAFAMSQSNKKAKQAKSSSSRGRPKRKALVAMYQSQITDNCFGIKIKLKKSLEVPITFRSSNTNNSSSSRNRKKTSSTTSGNSTPGKSRKRQRKSRHRDTSDSDDSEYEKRRRKERSFNNNASSDRHRSRKAPPPTEKYDEPEEQSGWGLRVPEEVLSTIFEYAVCQDGCLPTIVNVSKVCSLWRRISLDPKLWHSLDLSTWTKDRNELTLKWIIANHLKKCKELNLANWKVTNIECVLERLLEACPGLEGLTLSGWKGFTSDHLLYLVQHFRSLRRIDLSSINLELNPNRSAVGTQSLCSAIQILNSRLTHLYLAHNRLAGIPQIVSALSTYCPDLVLLDLSNVSTVAISHGILHIEKLQEGCPNLKVLRITNSHITLSTATLQEQMDSPGFPELEELSVASLADESRLMNDEFLTRILKTSTKLKLLDVRGCARLTHDTFIRLPTWDLKHLFLSGCSVTRDTGSGLELIASKWSCTLTELDLAWANVQEPLDNAIKAIAEKGAESPLNHLNLCGSSVSLEAVKEILTNCPLLNSINLSSCRGLPRGVKRLMQGSTEIKELRKTLRVKLKTSLEESVPSSTATVTTTQTETI